MVRQCVVCKTLDSPLLNVSFHKFPNDFDVRKTWFSLLSLDENKLLSKRAVICSQHFNTGDFQSGPLGRRYLKKAALPQPFRSSMIESFYCTTSDSLPPKQSSTATSLFTSEELTTYNAECNVESCSNPSKCRKLSVTDETMPSPSETSTASEHESNGEEQVYIKPETSEQELATEIEENDLLTIEIEKIDPLATEIEENDPLASFSSSSTLTASETEAQLLDIMEKEKQQKKSSSIELYEFKGKLSLVNAPKKKIKRYVGDITGDDFSTQSEAKHNFKLAKDKLTQQKKKVTNLQQTVRRLRATVVKLKSHLNTLKQNTSITESSESTQKR